jgi:hypothetical protein
VKLDSTVREDDLPEVVLRSERRDVIRKLAELMPGLRQALSDTRDAERKRVDAEAEAEAEATSSPPVRGARSGLEPPTLLQWLMQLLMVGHYWSEPSEAATFLVSLWGKDWATLAYQAVLFSPIVAVLTRGSCPRFRRLGNSYVSWLAEKRKLRGTQASDDELATLKLTFSIMALCGVGSVIFAMGQGLVGVSPGFSFLPPRLYFVQLHWWAVGIIWVAAAYVMMLVAGQVIWPQRLVGTRPSMLPTFMSLLDSSCACEGASVHD